MVLLIYIKPSNPGGDMGSLPGAMHRQAVPTWYLTLETRHTKGTPRHTKNTSLPCPSLWPKIPKLSKNLKKGFREVETISFESGLPNHNLKFSIGPGR